MEIIVFDKEACQRMHSELMGKFKQAYEGALTFTSLIHWV